MRFLALFSILCSIVATVISILLILAGNHVGFLEDVDILTLNTTNIGRTLASSPGSPLYSALNNPAVTSLIATNPTASAVAGEVGEIVQSIAEDIGLHEFYSLHMLDYCEGNYNPNGNVSTATKTVTACSNNTSLWTFNLTDVLQMELKQGIPVQVIDFPPDVEQGFQALETALRVMFYLYCVAAAVSGIGIITGLIGLLLNGRGSACLNIIWTTINVLINIAASVVATVVMSVATGVVNNQTDNIGVVATRGGKFLAMTWAAVAVLILGWLVWCIDCCVGGSRKKYKYSPVQPKVRSRDYDTGYQGASSAGYQGGPYGAPYQDQHHAGKVGY